jgi:hypothetical protein
MAAPLRPAVLAPEPALFEAMLEGSRRQRGARRLTGPQIEGRIRLVRRFTRAWPWQWTPAQVEDWITSGGWAHSKVRSPDKRRDAAAPGGSLRPACLLPPMRTSHPAWS